MKILKEIGVIFIAFGIGLTLLGIVFKAISLDQFLPNMIINGVGGALMWSGNGYLAEWLNKRYPWVENSVKRLILTIMTTIVYTFLAWLVLIYVWQIVFKGQFGLKGLYANLNIWSFSGTLMVTLLVSTFVHGNGFLTAWKQTLIEAERLKKDHIAAQYETLKNQVNPHFLFNSFNVLTTLVHKDADLAEQFVRQLSNVYRYVLDSRDKEVVPLEMELKQLEAYIFLMKIRFGESLKIDIKPIFTEGVSVAPLTLQMLIENALKHNAVSKTTPLSIEVFQEGADYIVVKNLIQLKNSVGESTGVGLENIRSRYKFLSDKAIAVLQEDGFFRVKIPIIK